VRYNGRMDLYALHPDLLNAPGYATRHDTVPCLIWERYQHQPEELRKREKALVKEARYAYLYAQWVLKGPFKAGEPAIAKNAEYAYYYACNVLKLPYEEARDWCKQ
jgi:hypothetical protein